MAESKKPRKASAANKARSVTAAKEFTLAALTHELHRTFEFLSKAGVQYGGKRDIWKTAGYVVQPTFEHYWGLYKRGDVAGRIVDMAPKTTWRTPPTVLEEGKSPEEGSTFGDSFTTMAKRLKLWRYFERVDRLSGVGRYAVLLIGTRGGEDLRRPLTKVGPDGVIYLAVYHEGNAKIDSWVTKASDERFGLPEMYKVKFTSGIENFRPQGAASEMLVHHSRVIHVAEDRLEDEVFGRPRLERALNRMFDLDKIAASTAEAYWQAVAKILQAKLDPQSDITPEKLKELDERLLEMIHDLRRQFTGKGVELGWLDTTVPPVKDIGDFYFSLIAGAAGIPQRILFGSEMGELASTTDQENWFGLINEREEQFAEPDILRAFIDRMITLGALPPPEGDEYEVSWPPLYEESESEIATTNLAKAQTAAALAGTGGDPLSLVTIDDDGTIQLLPQTAEEAEERQEMLEALPTEPITAPTDEPPVPGTKPEDDEEDEPVPPKPDEDEEDE